DYTLDLHSFPTRRSSDLSHQHKPMDLLKVWSVSGGLPLRERAKQRQAYRHQELRRWREFLGIPTYVFEGELFWGQDRLQMPEWRSEETRLNSSHQIISYA